MADEIMTAVIGGVSGGIVAFGGLWLQRRQTKADRAHAFRERQLQVLYGPVSMIFRKVEQQQRTRIRHFVESLDYARDNGEELKADDGKALLYAMVAYDEKLMRHDVYESLSEAAQLLQTHSDLADEDAVAFFPDLTEFLDRWDRAREIPTLKEAINFDSLQTLFECIHRRYEQLQREHRRELYGR